MRKYAVRQYAISASSFFSYSAFGDRFIGHMMLYIETENGSAMRADDLTRKGDARYVLFAVSGACAHLHVYCADEAL